MKHHCFLVRSSPASSRFYEHALTNSFQSFPAFPLQCPSDEGNFLPGDVWLDTRLDVVAMTAAPGLAYPYPAKSSANTILSYLVFSGKSKYAPVFSLLVFSCLCLLLFGISDVKADLCCQYFKSRFQKKYPHLSQ